MTAKHDDENVVVCTSDSAEHDVNIIRLNSVDTDVVVYALVWLRSLVMSVYDSPLVLTLYCHILARQISVLLK